MKVAMAAEGPSGAMIYSQNCYEALTHTFSWKRVDTCGAADALTAQRLDDATDALPSETAYFESEAVAGRYLAAVTGAGEEAEKADVRLEALQALVGKAAPQTRPAVDALSQDPQAESWNGDTNDA